MHYWTSRKYWCDVLLLIIVEKIILSEKKNLNWVLDTKLDDNLYSASRYSFTQLFICTSKCNAIFNTDLEMAQSSQRTHKSSSEFGGTEGILLAALAYREEYYYH